MKSLAVVSSFAAVALVSSASWAQAVGGSIEITTPQPPQAQVIVETPQGPPPQYYGQQPVYVQPGYAQPVYGQPGYYGVRRPYARPYLGGPIPPGAHVETRLNYGLIGGGIGLFAAAWLPMVFFLAAPGEEFLAIPIAGPLIGGFQDLGTNDPGLHFIGAWGLIDGLAQAGGAVMFIIGILNPRRLLVSDFASNRTSQPVRWAVMPGVHGAAGVAPGATLSIVNF